MSEAAELLKKVEENEKPENKKIVFYVKFSWFPPFSVIVTSFPVLLEVFNRKIYSAALSG